MLPRSAFSLSRSAHLGRTHLNRSSSATRWPTFGTRRCSIISSTRSRFRPRLFRHDPARRLVVILCRDFSLQRKFVCDGIDQLALARSNHAPGRTMLSRRLGLAVSGAAHLKILWTVGGKRSAVLLWRPILCEVEERCRRTPPIQRGFRLLDALTSRWLPACLLRRLFTVKIKRR